MNNRRNPRDGMTRRAMLKYGLAGSLTAGITPTLFLNACGRKKARRRPNIILITLDTTRADRLSCYGYYRRTSPNLDVLAGESILYTKAVAPSSWTLPSHASLFTGKYALSHGVKYDPAGPLHLVDAIVGPKVWEVFRVRSLAKNELTLAGILKATGYATAAVVGGPWLKRIFGLNKGFDYFDDREISSVNGRLARQVTRSAAKWLEQARDGTFFLFLNYFDPHGPYMPPEGFATAFLPDGIDLRGRQPSPIETSALYDAEILYMDHYIGLLVKKLKADNLYENSMIIVTADHGELLGEHGEYGHGYSLFQEEIHVPLFVKYPGNEVAPRRTDAAVQLNDIMPMILDRLGLAFPKDIQAGIPPRLGHPILSETYLPSVAKKDVFLRAIFEGDFKFIWNSKDGHLLFNLTNDPREKHNLAPQDVERVKRMTSRLNRYVAKLPAPGPPSEPQAVDKDTLDALRNLGYIE